MRGRPNRRQNHFPVVLSQTGQINVFGPEKQLFQFLRTFLLGVAHSCLFCEISRCLLLGDFLQSALASSVQRIPVLLGCGNLFGCTLPYTR
jgi:hypothetical protein